MNDEETLVNTDILNSVNSAIDYHANLTPVFLPNGAAIPEALPQTRVYSTRLLIHEIGI